MLIKNARNNEDVKIMDPDCAICSQPAIAKCECEANGLTVAVRQAEQRMMTSVYTDIRYYLSPSTPLVNVSQTFSLLRHPLLYHGIPSYPNHLFTNI